MTDELEDDLDLSAWEAPPPPSDLADGVLARMGGTAVGPSVPEAYQPRRRTWIIAGIAAACLAATAGTYALVRGTHRAAPTSGSVIAEQARTLSLDSVRAELDPGTNVTWRRLGGALHVEQRAGTATWRVDGNDTVVIDAGATSASVEATGASLRVEVKMNQMDARVIGGAALTAAVVAMVTVVVYEGHVKVSGSHGQPTVIVQPGSTYTVTPPRQVEPPVVGATVPNPAPPFDAAQSTLADVRLPAGESATIHAASLPVLVEIDVPEGCTLAASDDDDIDGSETTFELGAGTHAIGADCESGPQRIARKQGHYGIITVVRDEGSRALAPLNEQVNKINADGRSYRISFQDALPRIEVGGGSGTLHVVRGGVDQMFPGGIIPAGQLDPDEYTYWYDPAKPSKLTIELDDTAPVLYVADVSWGIDQTQIYGAALPHSTLSVRGLSVPLTDGRFTMGVAVGDVIALRTAHSHRGVHYFVLRAPKSTTVAVGARSLDRAAIMKVVAGAKARVAECTKKAATTTSGKVIVNVAVAIDGSVTSAGATATFDPAVSDCIVTVVKTLKFPAAKAATTFTYPFQLTGQPACDVTKLRDKATDNISLGQHGAALAQLEAALRCAPGDESLTRLAFVSACNSMNAAKATLYFPKLKKEDQKKLEQVCIRNSVQLTATATTASCDAQKLKEKGMANINMGQHAVALVQFEASLRCKDDPYVRQLAFMEACASSNSAKAQEYYPQLSPAQQTKFEQICIRQDPPVAFKPAPAPAGSGFLHVFSTPVAKILIDGVDTGLTTPIDGDALPLTEGKHKVTYVIDGERFTYPVVIKAGASQTITKDLQ